MKIVHIFGLVVSALVGIPASGTALDFPDDREDSTIDDQVTAQRGGACLFVDDKRDLHIPCARYKGVDYRFTIHSLINPIDPLKTIWKLDSNSLAEVAGGQCIEVGDDKRLVLPCVSFRGLKSDLRLKYYENPEDRKGHYWMNDPGGRGASGNLWYPEIYVVNDYSRYLQFGDETERNTGALLNVVSGLFATPISSSGDVPNNLEFINVLLVGQRTLTKGNDDVTRTLNDQSKVNPLLLLHAFAKWAEDNLPQTGATARDAAILLTSLEFEGTGTEAAYLGQMCNPSRAVGVVQATHYTNPAFDAVSIARVIGKLVGICSDPPGFRSPRCPTLPDNLATGSVCAGRIMEPGRNPSTVPRSFSGCSAFDFNDWLVNKSPRPLCLDSPIR